MSKEPKSGIGEYALLIGFVGIALATWFHPSTLSLKTVMLPLEKALKKIDPSTSSLEGLPSSPKWSGTGSGSKITEKEYGDPTFEKGLAQQRPARKPPHDSKGHNSPSAAPSAPQSDLILDEEQKEYSAAVQNAKLGSIKFDVPPAMTVGEKTTVAVRIYGPAARPEQQKDFPATGSDVLKVITPMLVTLSEPDNPDSFTIVEDLHESGNQFLPDNSFAEWEWTVTPLKGGAEPKKLRITAYMVFNARLPGGQPMQTQISSYTATVTVRIKPRWEAFSDWWSENWKTVLKYLVPSGFGLTALGSLIKWRRSKTEPAQPTKQEEKQEEKKEEPEEAEDDDEDSENKPEGS